MAARRARSEARRTVAGRFPQGRTRWRRRHVRGGHGGDPTGQRTVDVYLDTDDWRIGRSGFVLRIRHQGDQAEVTLKDTTPAVAGLRRRIEVSEPLPPEGLDALDPEGPVGRRLRALAGDAPLTSLLEIRTRRRPHEWHGAHDFLGEVDLDDTIIVVGDDQYPVRMRRVEVEVDSRWVDLAHAPGRSAPPGLWTATGHPVEIRGRACWPPDCTSPMSPTSGPTDALAQPIRRGRGLRRPASTSGGHARP